MMKEKIENMNGFWTELEELIEDLKDIGLEVTDYNDEYIAVANEDYEEEAIIYLGHANRTIWIDTVREM